MSPCLQLLEGRVVPTTFSLVGTTLSFAGSNLADRVQLFDVGGSLFIKDTSDVNSYSVILGINPAGLSVINFDGKAGDDTFDLSFLSSFAGTSNLDVPAVMIP